MVMLPSQPYRGANLKGFWLVVSASIGALVGSLLILLISPEWFGGGVAIAIVIAPIGLVWPMAVSKPYKAWNLLARYFAASARLALSGISFYIIVVTAGKMGSSLRLTAPAPTRSGWAPRDTLSGERLISPDIFPTRPSIDRSWILDYVSWAARSRNLWAVSLLPFLILLAAFETDTQRSVPSETYTLY